MPPKVKKKVPRKIGKNLNNNKNYGYTSRMSEYYFGSSNGEYLGRDSVWNHHEGEEWSCGGGGLNLVLLAIWAGRR